MTDRPRTGALRPHGIDPRELSDDDLVVGDVRGPNAHTRGHIPGSRPLVLGSPPPGADDAAVAELAKEVALRLRRP